MDPVNNPSSGCITAGLWLAKQMGAGLLSAVAVIAVGLGTQFLTEIPLLAVIFAGLAALAVAASARRQAAGALFLGPAMAIIILMIVPVLTQKPDYTDHFRAEAEQMLVSLKGQARVAHATERSNSIRTLTGPPEQGGCGVAPSELQGRYFRIRDEVVVTATGATLVAEPLPGNAKWGKCTYTFAWEGGQGEFVWSPP